MPGGLEAVEDAVGRPGGGTGVLASETAGTVFPLAEPHPHPVGVFVTAAELTNTCTLCPVPTLSEWRGWAPPFLPASPLLRGRDAQLPRLPAHRDDGLSVQLLPGGVAVSLTAVKCTCTCKREVRQSDWGEGLPAIDPGLNLARRATSGKPLQLTVSSYSLLQRRYQACRDLGVGHSKIKLDYSILLAQSVAYSRCSTNAQRCRHPHP